MTARKTVLFAALAAALLIATPAFAQDVPPPPETTENDAGAARDRLVGEYASTLFAGDDVAARESITALRTGADVTITQPATNADGTPQTDANGNPVLVTVSIPNPNGPMGWGEVDHSLGIAQALVEGGQAASFDEALFGAATTTTVTNADGTTTTTTTYSGGVLQMRADGMGWGQIAKELGFRSLGEIKSGRYADADPAEAGAEQSAQGRDTAKTARETRGKSADHKADRTAKAERVAARPEKVERIARAERPDRPERPVKPERGRP